MKCLSENTTKKLFSLYNTIKIQSSTPGTVECILKLAVEIEKRCTESIIIDFS